MVLSSSTDGSARIWKGKKVDSSAVVFSHYLHQPDTSGFGSSNSGPTSTISSGFSKTYTTSGNTGRNKPFSDEVSSSSFFFRDKFVVLSVKNAVLLYNYEAEGVDAKNDLKRLQSTGKYQIAHKWSVDGHSITAVSCLNSVRSQLIVASSSDRKLHILDSAAGCFARSIEASHDKSIHCIALPQPSLYAQVSSESYNIFATSATDNVINIWDIRTPRTVAR
jgi:WD40 repeat protein